MLSLTKTLSELFRPSPSVFHSSTKHWRYKKITMFRIATIMTQNSNSAPSGRTNSVYVQHSAKSEMMVISFEHTANGKTKSFNLYRRADEPLSLSLERIKLNMAKLSKTKKSKETTNQGDDREKIDLRIIHDTGPVDPSSFKNAEAWIEGAIMELNGDSYTVRRNEPQVTIMRLPTTIMKGFITLPLVDVANCDVHECMFVWYRQISSQERQELEAIPNSSVNIEFDHNTYWLHLATGLTYSPTIDDVAHHLKVVCHPSNGTKVGPPYSCLSGRSVELGPADCPFERRHLLTSKRYIDSSSIRFVTYNVLADLYADQEYSRQVLFAHCPPHALEIDYRRQLLLKEIHGYHADIICLQEVDRKEFIKTYEPYFKLVTNHAGVFNTKGGQVVEGVATFFRQDRFELVDSHRTILSRLIDPTATSNSNIHELDESSPANEIKREGDDLPNAPAECNQDKHPILDDPTSLDSMNLLAVFQEMRQKMKVNPRLFSRFTNRHTILQTNLLKFKDLQRTYVIVANTHLYFAPDADHIRLLQGSACVKYMDFIRDYYKKLIESKTGQTGVTISIIFCGDMNSTPDCGLFKLVHEGKVESHHKDWRSNEEETVENLSVETNLRLLSAYNGIPYTNYTPGFNGCLDYIYYESCGFDCEATIPLPDHDDVTAIEGIPSDVFPSDHLALVADLKFKDVQGQR